MDVQGEEEKKSTNEELEIIGGGRGLKLKDRTVDKAQDIVNWKRLIRNSDPFSGKNWIGRRKILSVYKFINLVLESL